MDHARLPYAYILPFEMNVWWTGKTDLLATDETIDRLRFEFKTLGDQLIVLEEFT